MSEEENPAKENGELINSHSSDSHHSDDKLTLQGIQELEEEMIKLAGLRESIEKPEEGFAIEKVESPAGECSNPFEVEESPFQGRESPESRKLKLYQNTLQELKEEISRLNRQIDNKAKSAKPDPTEEELFKIQALCRLNKIEAKALRTQAEELTENNQRLQENIETLKDESASKNVSSEKIESLKDKVAKLEQEFCDLSRPNEINIQDLQKVLAPDTSLKIVNEFYVNVAKRIGQLDTENNALSAWIKKTSIELTKLKEKLENSTARHKLNEEYKNKLKTLEDNYHNYNITEDRVRESIKDALEEYAFYSAKPENQHDVESAKNILNDMRAQANKEEIEIENLEFTLQEKKNLLRAAQVYGLQRSKTSTKLRTDMELLGMVLVEKEQAVSKLRRQIDECRIQTHQVQLDIKEVTDKKKNPFN